VIRRPRGMVESAIDGGARRAGNTFNDLVRTQGFGRRRLVDNVQATGMISPGDNCDTLVRSCFQRHLRTIGKRTRFLVRKKLDPEPAQEAPCRIPTCPRRQQIFWCQGGPQSQLDGWPKLSPDKHAIDVGREAADTSCILPFRQNIRSACLEDQSTIGQQEIECGGHNGGRPHVNLLVRVFCMEGSLVPLFVGVSANRDKSIASR